jgi:hypothetical protein
MMKPLPIKLVLVVAIATPAAGVPLQLPRLSGQNGSAPAPAQQEDPFVSALRNLQRRSAGSQPTTPDARGQRSARGGAPANPVAAAWWTNPDLVARLGLSEEQRAKIAMIFEKYRTSLNLRRMDLEREESLLARMLETDPMEPVRSIQSQIDRVVRTRADMERIYAGMSLEIRQAMTGAQWIQLQREAPQASVTPPVAAPNPTIAAPGVRRVLPSSAP